MSAGGLSARPCVLIAALGDRRRHERVRQSHELPRRRSLLHAERADPPLRGVAAVELEELPRVADERRGREEGPHTQRKQPRLAACRRLQRVGDHASQGGPGGGAGDRRGCKCARFWIFQRRRAAQQRRRKAPLRSPSPSAVCRTPAIACPEDGDTLPGPGSTGAEPSFVLG